ncbi:class I adenylate-forming enzyme family protein [Halomarina halobia]|uniref:Class I adenylate-forming enzyme family protein n=1 Tax=Halomarina halobia TaxID=3033386 RepID=A0ABD6AEF0_9EURY|nr:AMP-binding protein [Halomarina sp. PSR21]
MTGFGADTVRWTDGRVHHDADRFPIERIERDGHDVYGYVDRPDSLDAMLRRAVATAPDREAFVYPDRGVRVTYREFDERVDRLAAGLAANGVEPGDVVSVLLSNRPEFAETFFACARGGVVSAPINTRVSPREFGYLLGDADPACVVTEESFEALLDSPDCGTDIPPILVDSDRGRPYADPSIEETPPSVPTAADDPASLLYTSGTTGEPKGCVAEHFHLVNGALNYRTCFDTGDGLRTLVTVPLFHVAGLVANLLHTVANAGTTVVLDGSDPERFLRTIEDERIEFVLGVPTNYVLAMERADPTAYDLSSWRIAAYGGAPMPADSIGRLRDAFPGVALCDAYGTTETVGGLVTMCPDERTDDYAHTIGLPTPPVELAVVDDEREPLGPNAVGELAVRGPIVVQEYLNRPAATESAFDGGWYFTGDLASVTEAGFVELKGRSRDKIVRGGENIYALDVEEVLVVHDGVLEASVTSFPDAVLGERVLAAVVPKPGVRLTEDALWEHCLENLADYKVPELFRILDELPKNPGGKVLKADIVPEPLKYGIRAGTSE